MRKEKVGGRLNSRNRTIAFGRKVVSLHSPFIVPSGEVGGDMIEEKRRLRTLSFGVEFRKFRLWKDRGNGRRPLVCDLCTHRGAWHSHTAWASYVACLHRRALRKPNLGISGCGTHAFAYKAHTVIMEEPIGRRIKAELERQERSVTWFAKKLACHRTNIYDIFARDNIDMTLLIRISRILNHNFLKDLSETVEESGTFSAREPVGDSNDR